MTTQNELKQLAKEKGYFLDIVHHTKGKYTKKVEFIVTDVLGTVVYSNTFKWTQNADYEYEVMDTISKLPANNFKTLTETDDVDFLLSAFLNDDEPKEKTPDDGPKEKNNGTNLWDWFESEAA